MRSLLKRHVQDTCQKDGRMSLYVDIPELSFAVKTQSAREAIAYLLRNSASTSERAAGTRLLTYLSELDGDMFWVYEPGSWVYSLAVLSRQHVSTSREGKPKTYGVLFNHHTKGVYCGDVVWEDTGSGGMWLPTFLEKGCHAVVG